MPTIAHALHFLAYTVLCGSHIAHAPWAQNAEAASYAGLAAITLFMFAHAIILGYFDDDDPPSSPQV